ncbi:MAG: nicotinamide riboside transporter PnuC, partial [Fimbriimonadaceae bacterium]
VTGANGVYWVTREHIVNYPLQMISSLCYIKYFWDAKLPGQAGLMVLYSVMLIYGWWFWSRRRPDRSILRVTRVPLLVGIVLAAVLVLGVVGVIPILRGLEGTAVVIDATLLVSTIVAQFMTDRKWIENWPVWLAINGISVGLYVQRQYIATAILYSVFFALATLGWRQWHRALGQNGKP